MSPAPVTLIIPCLNEAAGLPVLLARLAADNRARRLPWELLFIDDGSTDDTFQILTDAAAGGALRVIQHQSNLGLALLSQILSPFVRATRFPSVFDALSFLDERSAGIHFPRSNSLTSFRCSALSSGASTIVGRRPRLLSLSVTVVASISASVFIMLFADLFVPAANRARLTSVNPITVAKVWTRSELSAH